MELSLNKCFPARRIAAGFITLLFPALLSAQLDKNTYNHDDYKNEKQFEKFAKRRKIISAWQINELKNGALVVKLKTNKNLIDELEKQGNKDLAEEKRLEAYFINKNIMEAFKDNFKFCKLYFIYSSASDSLLNGTRKGIFLDSALRPSTAIEMNEKFYLLAERDYVYNSSIGFVPEDSARFVKETGNPSGDQAVAVVKNKYGHQLKKPFPYVCGYGNKGIFDMAYVKQVPQYYYEKGGDIQYTIDKTQLQDVKNSTNREFKKPPAGSKTFMLDKQHAYEILTLKVNKFDEDLTDFYKGSTKPELDKLDKSILPFLY
jgi:hypothetical protein